MPIEEVSAMNKVMFLVLAAMLFSACVNESSNHYGIVEDDVYGRRGTLEYTQKSRAITEAVERMLTDSDIKNIYEIALKRAKDRGRARPTICVKDFEANVKPGVSDSMITGQVHREFVTAIRKTTKFTIVSISAREDMSDTFRAEVDTGAKAENPQHWGEYDSVDFYIKGSIAREGSAKRPLFFVNFEMIDYVNGTTIWNDTIRILK